jgi:regulator of replication initiation timing
MLGKKKIEATVKQLKMDKENLMRERDTLVESRNEVVESNLKLKRSNKLLEEEKNSRVTDKAVNPPHKTHQFLTIYQLYLQKEAHMTAVHEEETTGLRMTVQNMCKNLEILENRKYDNEHLTTVVEDLRFRVKGLVSENSKLKMEAGLVTSKLDACNVMIAKLKNGNGDGE